MSQSKTLGTTLALAAATLMTTGCQSVKSMVGTGHSDSSEVSCYGVNSCQGSGSCATQLNACKGHNSCKGKGVVGKPSKAACDEAGGSVYEG